jgi:hypothetical protein
MQKDFFQLECQFTVLTNVTLTSGHNAQLVPISCQVTTFWIDFHMFCISKQYLKQAFVMKYDKDIMYINITVTWVAIPCRLVDMYRRFWWTCCLLFRTEETLPMTSTSPLTVATMHAVTLPVTLQRSSATTLLSFQSFRFISSIFFVCVQIILLGHGCQLYNNKTTHLSWSSSEAFCISEIGLRSLARKLGRRMVAVKYKLSGLFQSISRRCFDIGENCLYSNKGIG